MWWRWASFLVLAHAQDVEVALDKDDCPGALNALQLHAARGLAEASREEKLRSSLQAKIDEFSERYNVSFQLGYRDTQGVSLKLAAGVDDHQTGKLMTPDTIIPVGSATKTWTAAAVLQLVEQGRVKFDDPLHVHVDPILLREHNTTLGKLWGNPAINKITVRETLGHRAGIEDFDNDHVYNWTVKHPSGTYTPFMYLESVNKSFVCKPDTCVRYSGVGFILLGFLLAEKLSADGTWLGYDQFSVIPEELRHEFTRTRFPLIGKCNKVPDMAHQYIQLSTELEDGVPDRYRMYWKDLIGYSCLNGWTMGNIALSAIDQASFLYYLLVAQKIISPEMVGHMTHTKHWVDHPTMRYGLGLESDSMTEASTTKSYHFLQHGGLDWGSKIVSNIADPHLGFSLVVSTNSYTGMNCSLPHAIENLMIGDSWGLCNFLDPVLAVFEEEGKNSQRLNCSSYYKLYPGFATCGNKGWQLD